jgi:hypothetical protein
MRETDKYQQTRLYKMEDEAEEEQKEPKAMDGTLLRGGVDVVSVDMALGMGGVFWDWAPSGNVGSSGGSWALGWHTSTRTEVTCGLEQGGDR